MTKCPVFTYDFQTKKGLELLYGEEYQRQSKIFLNINNKETFDSFHSKDNNSFNLISNSGIQILSNDQSLLKEENQPLALRSLRFSLLKNSKPNLNFWSILKENLEKKYIIVCCPREDDLSEGLGYSIMRMEEVSNNRILQIKNPWKILELDFDWGPNSSLWTNGMKDILKPDLEDESSFYISYEDFLSNFDLIHICAIGKWQEINTRGVFKFSGVSSIENKLTELKLSVDSLFHYMIEVNDSNTEIILGMHQEDENHVGVKETRPYLDMGVVILKYENDQYKYQFHTDSIYERDFYFKLDLPKGVYTIIPLSFGLKLKTQSNNINEIHDRSISNPLIRSIIRDIFEKFDIHESEGLNYKHIVNLVKRINRTIPKEDFVKMIKKYDYSGEKKNINDEYLTFSETAFLNLFSKLIEEESTQKINFLFESLGFSSKNLFSLKSRNFVLSINSRKKIFLTTHDSKLLNLKEIALEILIRKFGKPILEKNNEELTESLKKFAYKSNVSENENLNLASTYFYFNEITHTYVYGVHNDSNLALSVTLDFSMSKNLIFDIDSKVVSHNIDPHQFKLFIIAQAADKALDYQRVCKLSYSVISS